jgi:hypothetical protein
MSNKAKDLETLKFLFTENGQEKGTGIFSHLSFRFQACRFRRIWQSDPSCPIFSATRAVAQFGSALPWGGFSSLPPISTQSADRALREVILSPNYRFPQETFPLISTHFLRVGLPCGLLIFPKISTEMRLIQLQTLFGTSGVIRR